MDLEMFRKVEKNKGARWEKELMHDCLPEYLN